MKKNWKKVVIAFLGILAIGLCALVFVFRNELRTMNHIKKINDYPYYEMTYYADYGRKELEEQGGKLG